MFAFSQFEPRSNKPVTDMAVPMSAYLGAAAEQGMHDSLFASIYNHTELQLEEDDPNNKTIPADEANKRFGLPGLNFTEPMKVGVAELLQQRHQAQMDRNFFLSQDNHSIMAGLAGMTTQMAAGMMNPLDFGLMFMPFVGEAKALETVGTIGRGAFRQALNRGIFTAAEVAEAFPRAPKLVTSIIQGLGYAAVAEPMRMVSAHENLQDMPNPLLDIAEGGATAGAFHLALSSMARLFHSLAPDTRDAMMVKAADDFARGRETAVHDVARLDPAAWQERAFREDQLNDARLQQKYDSLYQDGARPIVPETPPEPERVQYTSQLDEIRKRGARTTRQVKELWPEAKLSNEQAAVLRRQAWGEPDPTPGAKQATLEQIIENARKLNEDYLKRKIAEPKDNGPESVAKPKEELPVASNPAPAVVAKVKEKTVTAKAAIAKENKAKKTAIGKNKQIKQPKQFNTVEDIIKFKQARVKEEVKLYKNEIGLTQEEAVKLQERLASNLGTDKFEKSLTPEKRAKMEQFFEHSPYNKINGPFEFWEHDKRYNPEELLGETDKETLAIAIVHATQAELHPSATSDRFLFAAIAAKQLAENGGTKSDVAKALDQYTTRNSSSQGDKAEFFKSQGVKINKFLESQGVDLPAGELGAKIKAADDIAVIEQAKEEAQLRKDLEEDQAQLDHVQKPMPEVIDTIANCITKKIL